MMQLTVRGVTLTISNWEERTGINHRLIRWRRRAGWTPEQCVGLRERPIDRSRIKIRANGNVLSIRDWSAITGIGQNTIHDRYVKKKWTAEEALEFKTRVRKPRTGPFRRTNKLTEFNGLTMLTKTIEVIDGKEIGRQAMSTRKAAGLSREQASKALGWPPYTLCRLERGEQPWRQNLLDKFNEVAKGWVNEDVSNQQMGRDL